MRHAVLLALAAPAAAGVAQAAVWQRLRPDGTVEFTNIAPEGGEWRVVKSATGPGRAGAKGARAGLRPLRQAARVIWSREHADGTVEFTNLTPVGARWKVLYRTGPGKAAALRGGSDRVPPRDTSPARFSRFDEHIRDQHAVYGIPRPLLRAIIKVESDYDPHVVSSAGAMGLMQLMPATAKDMGVTDPWDPRQNIMGGARYLQTLAQRFCKTPALPGAGGGLVCSFEETVKVLAGYHAGPGAVERYRGLPPYETTRAYVQAVLYQYEDFRRREAALADWQVARR